MTSHKLEQSIQQTLTLIKESQATLSQLKQYQNKATPHFFATHATRVEQALDTLHALSLAVYSLRTEQKKNFHIDLLNPYQQ